MKKTLSLVLLLSSVALFNCAAEVTATQAKNLAIFKSIKKSKQVNLKGTQDFQRSFDVLLTFEQELSAGPNGTPLPASVKPGNIFGRIQLCFNKELSEIKYKLFVFNDVQPSNRNALVTQAHLHVGKAGQNGDVFTFLFTILPTDCGRVSNGLLAEGTITNATILPRTSPDSTVSVSNVASVLDAIRKGQVYANVHGSNTCDTGQQGFAAGVIRGQIFTK